MKLKQRVGGQVLYPPLLLPSMPIKVSESESIASQTWKRRGSGEEGTVGTQCLQGSVPHMLKSMRSQGFDAAVTYIEAVPGFMCLSMPPKCSQKLLTPTGSGFQSYPEGLWKSRLSICICTVKSVNKKDPQQWEGDLFLDTLFHFSSKEEEWQGALTYI